MSSVFWVLIGLECVLSLLVLNCFVGAASGFFRVLLLSMATLGSIAAVPFGLIAARDFALLQFEREWSWWIKVGIWKVWVVVYVCMVLYGILFFAA